MPLAKKISTSVLPEELQNQIVNNFKKDEGPTVEINNQNTVVMQEKSNSLSPKRNYADSVNLRLTSGKRNDFKKFFTECEISMNQGFEMAVDFIIRESKAGRIKVSKSGITKSEE